MYKLRTRNISMIYIETANGQSHSGIEMARLYLEILHLDADTF